MPNDRVGGTVEQTALDLPAVALRTRAETVSDLAALAVRDEDEPRRGRPGRVALRADVEARGWHLLLALMSNGSTLEAASRALGISERTGRRRLSEAMSHYGVGSMLELGAAWATGRPR